MSGNIKVTVTVAPPSEDEHERSLFWVDPWDVEVHHIQGAHIQWELSPDSRRYWKITDVTGPDGEPLRDAYPGIFGQLHDYGDGGKYVTDANPAQNDYPYGLVVEPKHGNGPNAVASRDGSTPIDIDPTIKNGGSD